MQSGATPAVAAVLENVLQEAAEQRALAAQQAAAQRKLVADKAAAAGEALVARLVAGICARVATAADLEAEWQAERAVMEQRLEQSARMGHALLKHQKEQGEWLYSRIRLTVAVCS
jgi:predicted signal transduction protein with EAL and GGDEF domain